MSDYQIVNGCQTSHIVFLNQDRLRDDTSLPVKIIEAEDREIINEIVRATNRQTEIKDEAFVVLGDFHKRLERFFMSVDSDIEHKLVYERRKRQYADSTYTAKNIVTLTVLTNSFVSCCLQNPVDANDYYGVLLDRYKHSMYIETHSLWPYLLSATILKEVEKLCAGKAKPVLWKFRFIISALIMKSFGPLPPLQNDRSFQNYFNEARKICHNPSLFFDRVVEAERSLAFAIREAGSMIDGRNVHQDRKFVDRLLGRRLPHHR